MIEFFLSRYYSYKWDDVTHISNNITDNEYLLSHIEYLEKRYKRFLTVYRVRSFIIKFIPILALLLYMIYPLYFLAIAIATILIIVTSESITGYFFPRAYFDKIHSNITIIKSIIKFNNN